MPYEVLWAGGRPGVYPPAGAVRYCSAGDTARQSRSRHTSQYGVPDLGRRLRRGAAAGAREHEPTPMVCPASWQPRDPSDERIRCQGGTHGHLVIRLEDGRRGRRHHEIAGSGRVLVAPAPGPRRATPEESGERSGCCPAAGAEHVAVAACAVRRGRRCGRTVRRDVDRSVRWPP